MDEQAAAASMQTRATRIDAHEKGAIDPSAEATTSEVGAQVALHPYLPANEERLTPALRWGLI
jgi:hypothetical protein